MSYLPSYRNRIKQKHAKTGLAKFAGRYPKTALTLTCLGVAGIAAMSVFAPPLVLGAVALTLGLAALYHRNLYPKHFRSFYASLRESIYDTFTTRSLKDIFFPKEVLKKELIASDINQDTQNTVDTVDSGLIKRCDRLPHSCDQIPPKNTLTMPPSDQQPSTNRYFKWLKRKKNSKWDAMTDLHSDRQTQRKQEKRIDSDTDGTPSSTNKHP